MSEAPPRLDTPEGRDAYRRELRTVARPWRYGGLALILLGAVLGGVHRFTTIETPAWTTHVVFILIVAGWAAMMFAILQRTLHHRRRYAGKPGSN
jgi:membrane protein YdbS with pleckstrin-like domain